ncbi:hypothetical protein [Haloarcula sp. H-GB5]
MVLSAGCSGFLSDPTPTPEQTESAPETIERTSTADPTPEVADASRQQFQFEDSPFGKERVIVGINDTVNYGNFTSAASDALSYWNEYGSTYGRYDAHFVLQPNATNPDIELRRSKQVNCPKEIQIGCSPTPAEETVFNGSSNHTAFVDNTTVIVRIESSSETNWRMDRNNVIHEMGHMLGLNHYNYPIWVMAPPGKGIKHSVKDVSETSYPWRDPELKVYVDTSNVSKSEQSQVVNSTQEVIEYYNSGAEDTRIKELNLELTDSQYKADIIINPGASVSDIYPKGRSVDRDANLEYLVKGVIDIGAEDTDRSYDLIGRMMAYLTRPGSPPPEFKQVTVGTKQG